MGYNGDVFFRRCKMRAAGMTAALAMYWLTGVVGAASLPPDDQYSPQQSPYERDAARGPRRLPNWLEYHRDPSAGLESPETKPAGAASLGASDLSRDRKSRKESTTRDLDFLSLAPGGWNAAGGMKEFTGPPHPDPEGLEMSPASLEDPFEEEDTFQDQGPGSVEVYKLDLRRENSLLVPQAKRRQPTVASRTKSKAPKKAKGQEILWKLKHIESSKASLPAIFRHPPGLQQGKTIPEESMPNKAIIKAPSVQQGAPRESISIVEENAKDEEVFAVGGVPELQVGCEGLEASGRRKRSSGKEDDQEDDGPRFKDPVYRESTEPILLRVTPIVLDFEDEPPSGQIYEELDELLKLKSSTTPAPSKPANRGDIDPALENYGREEDALEQTFPERGDLGTGSGKVRVERSIWSEDAEAGEVEGVRLPRAVNGEESLTETLSPVIESHRDSRSHSGGRKLLWVEHEEGRENEVKRRHHRQASDRDPDLWGFGEDDGVKLNGDEDSLAERLRNIEVEKRLREWERRRQEDEERRRGGHGHRPHSRHEDVSGEIERIRQEYDRQQAEQQRERQRIEEERMRKEKRKQWEDQRRAEEARRRQSEESRRRAEEEEERRNPSHSRGREEEERRREWNRRREEEERRIRLEAERRNESPPSPLTRPSTNQRPDNRSRSEEEAARREEERKLREYMERNRPIDLKRIDDRRRLENRTRTMEEEERRRHAEAQRRRQMEEERRRQMEEERRRQVEEERRRQMEEERRRQMEEQRRRDRPDEERVREEERRRQMEEQRRRDRPDEDRVREEERRRQMEEQRRRDRPDEDRAREEERRRQMEEQRRRNQVDEDRVREEERRRQMEEQRLRVRPDPDRAREEERRRRLEEERKLQEYVRRNQPVNVPRRNQSRESDYQEQRRTLNEARQWEHNRDNMVRPHDGRSHGPSAPTDVGQRRTPFDVAEARRRQEAERLREAERRRFLEEGRRREEQHRREESRRHEEERRRLEAVRLREEAQRRRTHVHVAHRPANSTHRGGDAGELRRHHQPTQRVPNNSRRIQEDEWRRRSAERQRQQQAARERMRIEQERNRNYGRRRPQPGDPGLNKLGPSVRRNQAEEERRRREEEARLKALPVSARIIVRSDGATGPAAPPPPPPPDVSIGSRAGFGNEIDFPAISPNRRGLEAARFPAPPTPRPLAKSPSACVWAIVNCCPANNRVATCFESMGCPGANWDPSPCRPAIQSSAQSEVLRFFESAKDDPYTRH